jgi:guanylate kinase
VIRGLPHRPPPLVLAAPSGTGKTTIARALVSRHEEYTFSVSATTRPARRGEVDGADYQFVSHEEFDRMIREDQLVEWAEVHGNHYGTPRRSLEHARSVGRIPVLDIDVQGARQIRERIPEAVLVFVFPPSADALWERLTARGTEALEEVRRRLQNARGELGEAAHFDYVVVNDELERAVGRVRAIVEAESQRPSRILDLRAAVGEIQAGIERLVASPSMTGKRSG